MGRWARFLVAAVGPLVLGGCLWSPGKFTSELALRKGGTFTLDYKGEILLQMPDEMGGPKSEPWRDDMARCHADGTSEIDDPRAVIVDPATGKPVVEDKGATRPCTAAEIARLKNEHQRQIEKQRTEGAQMAKVFGLPGADDESNRRFAATMMKYQGWRSVRYVGKGVFDVDYHFEGRAGQDYAFPMMPDADFIVPFITIRRRTDGTVVVTAPALTGGSGPFGARAKAMGLPDKSDGPAPRAEGRFTILTDGDILTNNSEDGPVAGPAGKQVRWDVGPGSAKVPEMLVRL